MSAHENRECASYIWIADKDRKNWEVPPKYCNLTSLSEGDSQSESANMEARDKSFDQGLAGVLAISVVLGILGIEWAFPVFVIAFAVAVCFALASLVSVAIYAVHGAGWEAGIDQLKSQWWRGVNVGIGVVGLFANALIR